MSAALHLARPDDLERLLPMAGAFHDHMGIESTPEHRAEALLPLLEGAPHGAVYLIGPARAPVGYIVVSFGWSIEHGGLTGTIAEFYIRPSVRRRGMGLEVLTALCPALKQAGVKALTLEVRREDEASQRFYRRAHFRAREGYGLMIRIL